MAGDRIVRHVEIRETGADKVIRSFDRLADAAVDVAAATDKATVSAGKAQPVYDRMAGSADKAGASQDRLNARLENGQRVFDRTLRVVGGAESQFNRLQRSIDPAFRAAEKLAKAEDTLNTSFARGLTTLERHNELMALARDRFATPNSAVKAFTEDMKNANDNIALAGHQMANLRSQAIDAGTMLASGSSPLMILSTQAGQVYEALASHPRGVGGALKALGASALSAGASLAAAMGPVGLAIAGVTAGMAGLVYAFREDLPDAAETMERHSAVLDRVTSQYDDLKEKLAKIGEAEEAIGLRIDLEIDRKNIERQLKEAMRDADLDFTSYIGQAVFGALDFADAPTRGVFDPIRKEVDAFREALKRGETEAVIPFRQRLQYLYELAGDDKAMRTAIEAAMTYTDTLSGLTVKADEAAAALQRMGIAEKGGRLRVTGRDQEEDLMPRINPEGWDAIRDGLRDQAKELTEVTTKRREAKTEAEKYADTMGRQRDSIRGEVDSLRLQIDTLGMTEGAAAALRFETNALAEARRAATAAGEVVSPSQIKDINAAAREIGTMTDQLAALNKEKAHGERLREFMDELNFEASVAHLPEVEREIAASLRDVGLTFEEETAE